MYYIQHTIALQINLADTVVIAMQVEIIIPSWCNRNLSMGIIMGKTLP